ncbi:hypothetical protein X762_32085 [Mesorhizobium sp. LSHC426A00]|nr:hypothetical protein X762_32085 [Mesorhizobium sp. LSHC426A00]ESX43422.1 hypothetical protein X761_33020 [Mesorhizobium sp. LSHC424B00]ESY04450.1 hypothetical protein X753_17705 [Mesorhizobium sp. LNJC399B00]ESY19170.1 hypothetical protein X750_20590 [Mesorhizobium sp. LNJC394B00]
MLFKLLNLDAFVEQRLHRATIKAGILGRGASQTKNPTKNMVEIFLTIGWWRVVAPLRLVNEIRPRTRPPLSDFLGHRRGLYDAEAKAVIAEVLVGSDSPFNAVKLLCNRTFGRLIVSEDGSRIG